MIIWYCKAHLGIRKMRYRNKLLLLLLLLLLYPTEFELYSAISIILYLRIEDISQ